MSRHGLARCLLSVSVAVAIHAMAPAQSYNWIRNPANGHLYAVTAPMTWQAAEAAAVAAGGHLATVRSQTENSWIVTTFGAASSKWIGFNDVATEGAWVWSSGESPGYTNWCAGEPNNAFGNEDGGLLGECLPLGWNDRNTGELRAGVIEVFGPPCAILPSAMGCYPGVDGPVYAMAHWDPDGPAGPSSTMLVIGGLFPLAGSTRANTIVVHDPVSGSWSPLGSHLIGGGTNGAVRALTVLGTGDLVAGGDFQYAGVTVNRIARWNVGSRSWSPLGVGANNGTNDQVRALVTLPNGRLVAGGTFTAAGGVAGTSNLAQWDPLTNAWSSLGVVNAAVNALAVLSNGDLIIGGVFNAVGSVAARGIARRSAATGAWSPVGAPVDGVDGPVFDLHARPNGSFAVGGDFGTAGGVPAQKVALWDGITNSWSGLGAGVDNGPVYALTTMSDGRIAVGGDFTSVGGGLAASRMAAWDEAYGAWSALATGADGQVNELISSPSSGALVAAGTFSTASGRSTRNIARWDGVRWLPLCTGLDSSVYALTETASGNLLAGGSFVSAGTSLARYVAMWNGVEWTPFGAGIDGAVRALTTLPNGDIVAGGEFRHAAGIVLPNILVNYIARWSGGGWWPIGSGMSGSVRAVLALPNGQLIAGGTFAFAGGSLVNSIAHWNGSSWQSLAGGMNGTVHALVRLSNGHLIAGGSFTVAGSTPANNIALWNGLSWSSLGQGGANGVNGAVQALTVTADGSVVAGGSFTTAGGSVASRVARWDGTAWSALGAGMTASYSGVAVYSLTTLANGHVVAGGSFSDAGGLTGANNLARWDGSQWTRLLGTNAGVLTLSARANGDLVAGGYFSFVYDGRTPLGQVLSPNAARILTTCPPIATRFGTACPGLYGEVPLTLVSQPYVGSTFRARSASSMANLAVTGLSRLLPPVPLSSLLPQGVPGCDVLVSPDLVDFVPAVNSSATSQVPIPNTAQLVGMVFHHQMLLLDGSLQVVTDITSTDALTLTIGSM